MLDADLHVLDGRGHPFYMTIELPEPKQAIDVLAKVFTRKLGLAK